MLVVVCLIVCTSAIEWDRVGHLLHLVYSVSHSLNTLDRNLLQDSSCKTLLN